MVLTAVILAGCATPPVPFTHPTLDKAEWSKDFTECKRYADRQTGYRETQGAFAQFDRDEAKKREQGFTRYCMLNKGYFPAKRQR